MRIKKTLLLLVLCLSSFLLKAQSNFIFPLSGNFIAQQIEGQPINKYDQVTIEGNNFQILKENQVLKYFKILELTESGYKVEQYFPENDDPKRDRERFYVKMEVINETESLITIIKPLRTEQVRLIKI